jgi:TRAP-type C4-dicarboxylate transport system substrate-binding protein
LRYILREEDMKNLNIFTTAIAAVVASVTLAQAETLRLSHQWSESDVRHQVAQMVADEVAAANVDLDIQIYPNQTLFKAKEQYTPLSRGQVDMIVFPLSYAGGQQPAYNLTLMPGMVKNHDHGARLSHSPFMKKISEIMAEDDIMVVTHGYLAGGFGSNKGCITNPDDMPGVTIRAAGKAFEQMLAGAGASIASMASSEAYPALQSGVLDAINTSSESFVSYRLYEQVKCYTPAGDFALWFMYQPLLMNKSTFEALNPAQQAALLAAGAKAEAFYLGEAKKGDAIAAKTFADAGVDLAEMTEADFNAWRELAKTTSYPAFVAETPNGQALLDLALSVE